MSEVVHISTMRADALALVATIQAAGARTVFEFGCGDCLILEDLQARGMEVTGYEPAGVASRAGDAVAVYPYFEAELPGIPDGHYEVGIALGSLDRMATADKALQVLAELARVSSRFLLLGFEIPGRLNAADRFRVEAARLGRITIERARATLRTLVVDRCLSST